MEPVLQMGSGKTEETGEGSGRGQEMMCLQ